MADGITLAGASPAPIRAEQRVLPMPVKAGVDVMDDMRQADVSTVDLRLGLVHIGDSAIGCVSGEITVAIAEHLRGRSSLRDTVIVSLVNDRIGYIPEDSAYDRPTHCVNGAPIARGHAEDTVVSRIPGMITNQ